MISVIIPLYNKERQIRATLESVLRQSYTDYEIVVVDDGSTDGSAAVVESVHDARLRLIRQENGGVSAARNRGIRESRGEYVAFLDADDLWDPDFLKTLQHLAERYPDCSVYACNYDFVSPDGSHHPTIIRHLPFTGELGILSNYFEVASCSHPPICSISLMVKKEAMQAIGGFPLGIKWGEDLLTWARLACLGSVAYTKQKLAEYCFTPSSRRDQLPADIEEVPDKAGRVFEQLLKENAHTPHLREYVSFWYKMRAHINLTWGNTRAARAAAIRAIRLSASNWKAYMILLLSILPPPLTKTLVKLK